MDSQNIITQESLLTGSDFEVLEASLDQAQTRSNEPDADVQCGVITDRGRHSSYKVQALLKTCIHGVLDAKSNKPASLIIVDYSLSNLKENGHYSSVTTIIDFKPYMEDEGLGDVDENPLDTPNVTAYAPFEKPERWDLTTAKKDSKHRFDSSIEPEYSGIKAVKISYTYETAISHEQRYFSQGLAGRHFIREGPAKNIADQVWWNLQHNFCQQSGVPLRFRTAILVTRHAEAANAKFQARFNIAVRGGIGKMMSDMINVFLRRNVPDKPVVFDPQIKLVGDKLEGIEPNADGVYELGHLAQGRELVKLCEVWGLNPLQMSQD
ncbi:Uncharacterized protein TPAR_03815 [Tolypocladium paradoxum]|uniref:Uncharacterized protein n=1 Tax=Tolypocladium paradoxum TaxID=94208 RepID=A0A2S4L0N5_9HYPO|nr:Uncharacterized protein TPAR_03815 [Tolypocladium paradoxum]